MTSALEGGGGHGKADEGNRGCVNVTVRRGRGKKSENFADVIYGRSQRKNDDFFEWKPISNRDIYLKD